MKTIESMLKKEMYQLKKIADEAEVRLKTAPEGHLRISKKKNRIEYYYKSEEGSVKNKNGKYLKKKEENVARKIAQRDYDANILRCVTRRLKTIDSFMENYKKTSLDETYQETNSYRRELIDTAILSDDEYIRQWQAVQYKGKPFADNTQVIITERGERVRSKSEKIIADKLYMLGIPYRYEYLLILDGNIKMYPDFTILRMPGREEVYLEHFGMMDDADYVDTAICKINTYERNGIYPGERLFFTHETSKNPLNTKVMDKMIRAWFCEE